MPEDTHKEEPSARTSKLRLSQIYRRHSSPISPSPVRRLLKLTEHGSLYTQVCNAQLLAWTILTTFCVPAEGRGFLKDPQNRLEVVGVSLFHQLHCLVSTQDPSTKRSKTHNPPRTYFVTPITPPRPRIYPRSIRRKITVSTQNIASTICGRL